jgi:hypothetical protein
MPASASSQQHAVERAGKIFAILRQCAERGEICPTNAILAERFGVRTGAIVSGINFLECNGMIEVERTRNTRVVTICSTGKQTASESHRRAA